MRLRGRKSTAVKRGVHEICIDGFMRSGNTFAVDTFQLANPGVEVAHHMHSTGQLRRAVKLGIPVVVPVRAPVDAIVSYLIYYQERDPDDAFFRYLLMHRWVRDHLDEVVVADFETLTSDPNVIIRRVNERYGTSFALVPDLAASQDAVVEGIRERWSSQVSLPVPNPTRDPQKEELRPLVSQHRKLREAEDLYRAVVTSE